MRLGHFTRSFSAASAAAVTLLLAAPASAQNESHGAPPPPPVHGTAGWNAGPAPYAAPGLDPRARADWIDECTRRMADRDSSSYYGWKRERRQAADRANAECTRYLDDYYAYYARAAQNHGTMHYGIVQHGMVQYGGCCQGQQMMMVPATRRAEPECTETVEEIVEEVSVAPRARRVIRQRARPVPDKRIRIAPDKRVRY